MNGVIYVKDKALMSYAGSFESKAYYQVPIPRIDEYIKIRKNDRAIKKDGFTTYPTSIYLFKVINIIHDHIKHEIQIHCIIITKEKEK